MRKNLLRSCCVAALVVVSPAWGQNGAANQGDLPNANPAGKPGGTNQSQGGGAPTEPSGRGTLETVIVTAQKRSEAAQKIPIPVVTISPLTLSRSGVRDFDNITKVLPDVHVEDIFGATNLTIRGVRESGLGPTSDSPTAVHLDGAYIARSTGLSGLFYDLQRVEELPGPQGTLYGRNATGGVINLITNKPTDTLTGNIETEFGSYGLYRAQGALSGPISPYVDLRGAFHFYGHDAYYAQGFNDADQKGGRLEAKIKATPDLTILLSGDFQNSFDHGEGTSLFAQTYTSFGSPKLPGPGPKLPPLNIAQPSNPFGNDTILFPDGRGPARESSKTYGGMVQADYDLGWATLTGQGAVRRLDFEANATNLANPYLGPNQPIGYSETPAEDTTYSAELRLASASRVPLQWVAGLFYFTEKSSGDMCAHATFTSTSCLLQIDNPFQRDISYAAFGQTTYTPPVLDNALHITGGVRYNYDQKNGATFLKAVFAPPGANGFLDPYTNFHPQFHAITYKAELSYDITPLNLVYAQDSTGFRAGGIAYGGTPTYKPETIQAYEIGSKNRFLQNTLQVNLAGYHYIYENQERNVISPPPPQAPFLPFSDISVQSIGKVHYTGASMALEYAATPDDRVELNVQYLDAHYANFQLARKYVGSVPLSPTGFPTGETPGDQTGLQVLNTPPWSGTFAYDHRVDAYGGAFDGRVAIQFSDVQHFQEFPTDTLQYQYGTTPAYARLDLSLSYERGNYRVTGYVNNVTGEYDYIGNFYERTFGSGTIDAQVLNPRTFGIILSAKL